MKEGTADLPSGWAGGPAHLHEKTNHPTSEQAGIQSLYCQGPLPVTPPLSKPIEKPQAWECPGEGRQCGETSVLCPLAWAVPAGRVHGEGRSITPPAEDVALAGMRGG